jgi:hypothetical protein
MQPTEARRADDPAIATMKDLIAAVPGRDRRQPKEIIDHHDASGALQEITRQAYLQFQSALPPPKIEHMDGFASGQRREPLTLCWTQDDRYFARKLTWPETFRLYDAKGLPDDLGAP